MLSATTTVTVQDGGPNRLTNSRNMHKDNNFLHGQKPCTLDQTIQDKHWNEKLYIWRLPTHRQNSDPPHSSRAPQNNNKSHKSIKQEQAWKEKSTKIDCCRKRGKPEEDGEGKGRWFRSREDGFGGESHRPIPTSELRCLDPCFTSPTI